ncbi:MULTISPECIES: hypothetical protein [Heyndrickxia]|uniref:hypothetical protein n=1 Tax=Heyndrickxia TaxID=2837504 RepID=UPI000210FEEA|nr:hypothetical protein [Heyndrickxia coagulans]AEH54004.1 hypothetical protein BCO26_1945 [Heyndrickxia coagulans 2-6]MED4313454.1 hypothetical protein [Heyndrickxia coagulans]
MGEMTKKMPKIPAEPEMTIASDQKEFQPGESVDEHANLEAANETLNQEEIRQQTENL